MIGNARMYAVAPGAASAWRALLAHVAEVAGVPLDIIDHPWPAPLPALWARADLGCAFICGWPYAKDRAAGIDRPVLAAPVPVAEWSAGQPLYRSEFLVRADSPARGLEDTFGTRYAYSAEDSHSGYNAPRTALSAYAARAPLFAQVIGPLGTPRRCVEALVEGVADVTAADSFALDLLRRHAPDLMARTRVIGATDASPIPLLTASPGADPARLQALRAALLGLAETAAGRALLAEVCLRGFVAVPAEAYDVTLAWAPLADRRGYTAIA
jgi:ABC-type phosphate/phosphonate transport system substrate-binding protein